MQDIGRQSSTQINHHSMPDCRSLQGFTRVRRGCPPIFRLPSLRTSVTGCQHSAITDWVDMHSLTPSESSSQASASQQMVPALTQVGAHGLRDGPQLLHQLHQRLPVHLGSLSSLALLGGLTLARLWLQVWGLPPCWWCCCWIFCWVLRGVLCCTGGRWLEGGGVGRGCSSCSWCFWELVGLLATCPWLLVLHACLQGWWLTTPRATGLSRPSCSAECAIGAAHHASMAWQARHGPCTCVQCCAQASVLSPGWQLKHGRPYTSMPVVFTAATELAALTCDQQTYLLQQVSRRCPRSSPGQSPAFSPGCWLALHCDKAQVQYMQREGIYSVPQHPAQVLRRLQGLPVGLYCSSASRKAERLTAAAETANSYLQVALLQMQPPSLAPRTLQCPMCTIVADLCLEPTLLSGGALRF